MDAARRIAALTHGDRAAWEGTAVFHELIRVALAGDDPLNAVEETLRSVHPDHRERYAVVLAPDWHPDRATEFNGAVWPCLASAVWSLRTTSSYEDALRAAIDLGGDTDTVAAVTGGLAGGGVRGRGDPGALERGRACAAAGVRRAGAAGWRTGRTGTAVGRPGPLGRRRRLTRRPTGYPGSVTGLASVAVNRLTAEPYSALSPSVVALASAPR